MVNTEINIVKRFMVYTMTIILMCVTASCGNTKRNNDENIDDGKTLPSVAFNADSAYSYVEKQVNFGPRVPGSKSHRLCGDWLVSKFKDFGMTVVESDDEVVVCDGKTVRCRNITASTDETKSSRVLLISHWDCRPWCDNDEEAKWELAVDGADDGASGVGVLLEVARQLQKKDVNTGVDILLTDIEDYGFPQWELQHDEGSWCIGAKKWAEKARKDGYKAKYGVLLDMVGGEGATFPMEGYSNRRAPQMVDKVWRLADEMGYGSVFRKTVLTSITDDHIPVNEIAGIPTVDIIRHDESGFAWYWHTADDGMKNISKTTLETVGKLVMTLITLE